MYAVCWQSPKTADGSVSGERSSVLKKLLLWAALWEWDWGLAKCLVGGTRVAETFRRHQLLKPWTAFRSLLDRYCEAIFTPVYLQFFLCSGYLCVIWISGVNLLLLGNNTWHTGQVFCHYHPGTLWLFKWTVKKSRLILPNLGHLTLGSHARRKVSLTCVCSRRQTQTMLVLQGWD